MAVVLKCYSDLYVNGDRSLLVSPMNSSPACSSSACSEETDRQTGAWQTAVRGAAPEIDRESELLVGAVWSKQTAEQGVGVMGGEGEGGIERRAEGGGAVSQSWEEIGLEVTTPSMRWFSTEGNGAWVVSHKKQFIAEPMEVCEIRSLAGCQIFSATNCAASGLKISTWGP